MHDVASPLDVKLLTFYPYHLRVIAASRKRTDKPPQARLLAPFDPVVWDRRRFESFWGWRYRFEAYTPKAQRKLGYYSLPLLWRDDVIGWGNLSCVDERFAASLGYVTGKAPRAREFRRALEEELSRIERFLSPRRGG